MTHAPNRHPVADRQVLKVGDVEFRWPEGAGAWHEVIAISLARHPDVECERAVASKPELAANEVGLSVRMLKHEVFVSDGYSQQGLVRLFAFDLATEWPLFKLVADTVIACGAVALDDAMRQYEDAINRQAQRARSSRWARFRRFCQQSWNS